MSDETDVKPAPGPRTESRIREYQEELVAKGAILQEQDQKIAVLEQLVREAKLWSLSYPPPNGWDARAAKAVPNGTH